MYTRRERLWRLKDTDYRDVYWTAYEERDYEKLGETRRLQRQTGTYTGLYKKRQRQCKTARDVYWTLQEVRETEGDSR